MNVIDRDQSEYLSVCFDGLNVPNEKFEQLEFDGCTFINCDFSECIFYKCKFIDCSFEKCNLSLVQLDYSQFFDVSFNESKVIGVNWDKPAWPSIIPASPISFVKCILNDSSFFGLNFREIVIKDCKVHDADFREGDFSKGNFEYTDFKHSQFSGTNLYGCSFIEAINYQIDINNNNIKKAKFTRYNAIQLLESLDIIIVD